MTSKHYYIVNQYLLSIKKIIDNTIADLFRVNTVWESCNGYYKKVDVVECFTLHNSKIYSIINDKMFINTFQQISAKDYKTIYNLLVPAKKFIYDTNFKQLLGNYKTISNIISNNIRNYNEQD